MSSYNYVSSKRHFCPSCKTWVPDNPTSRKHHDSSLQHKRNTQSMIRTALQTQKQLVRDAEVAKAELHRIEKAALKSIDEDAKLYSAKPSHPLTNSASSPTFLNHPQDDPSTTFLSGSWITCRAFDGSVFYKNEVTGATQKQMPDALKPTTAITPSTPKPLSPKKAVVPSKPQATPTKPRDDGTGLGLWEEATKAPVTEEKKRKRPFDEITTKSPKVDTDRTKLDTDRKPIAFSLKKLKP